MKSLKVDDLIELAEFAITPTIMVVLLSFIFMLLPISNIGFLQTVLVLPTAFIICPIMLLAKRENLEITQFGLRGTNVFDICICMTIICCLLAYCMFFRNYDITLTLITETLIVAVCEEFWARGVLFYILEKMNMNWVMVVLISSLIFVFVTHMNRSPFENLLYRLPGALVMGLIYKKTGKLTYSITFHYCYNIIGSI